MRMVDLRLEARANPGVVVGEHSHVDVIAVARRVDRARDLRLECVSAARGRVFRELVGDRRIVQLSHRRKFVTNPLGHQLIRCGNQPVPEIAHSPVVDRHAFARRNGIDLCPDVLAQLRVDVFHRGREMFLPPAFEGVLQIFRGQSVGHVVQQTTHSLPRFAAHHFGKQTVHSDRVDLPGRQRRRDDEPRDLRSSLVERPEKSVECASFDRQDEVLFRRSLDRRHRRRVPQVFAETLADIVKQPVVQQIRVARRALGRTRDLVEKVVPDRLGALSPDVAEAGQNLVEVLVRDVIVVHVPRVVAQRLEGFFERWKVVAVQKVLAQDLELLAEVPLQTGVELLTDQVFEGRAAERYRIGVEHRRHVGRLERRVVVQKSARIRDELVEPLVCPAARPAVRTFHVFPRPPDLVRLEPGTEPLVPRRHFVDAGYPRPTRQRAACRLNRHLLRRFPVRLHATLSLGLKRRPLVGQFDVDRALELLPRTRTGLRSLWRSRRHGRVVDALRPQFLCVRRCATQQALGLWLFRLSKRTDVGRSGLQCLERLGVQGRQRTRFGARHEGHRLFGPRARRRPSGRSWDVGRVDGRTGRTGRTQCVLTEAPVRHR
ncbi:hypothetical protein GCM10009565_52070 [Amycolatopsis albidoflavus]